LYRHRLTAFAHRSPAGDELCNWPVFQHAQVA
jgi:hypothetical protein